MKKAALLLLAACSARATDHSRWPRLYPVIFVHGVASNGRMWAIESGEADMTVKTHQYDAYKGERGNLAQCYSEGPTPLMPNLQSVWDCNKTYPYVDINSEDICGNTCYWENGEQTCVPATCGAPQPTNVNMLDAAVRYPTWSPFFQFDDANKSIPFAAYYDKLQYDLTGKSRTFDVPSPMYFGNPQTGNFTFYGIPAFQGFPTVSVRNNGLEMYTSYWEKSWADGNPPAKFASGDAGMLYGTYAVTKDYAPYARYAVTCGDKWIPISQAQWKPLYRPSAWEPTCIGATYQSYYAGAYPKSGPDAQGIITYKFQYTASGLPTRYITLVERPSGMTQEQFPEESKFGQIGQLYLFVKKVLDKYYVDNNGNPNWYLGNGLSDPDAKVVLFGHSQGGVLSRALMYPGFSALNTYDSDPNQNYYPMYWPASLAGTAYKGFDGSAKTMSGYFDPRKHVAAVVTSSSPHYGSALAFAAQGFVAIHDKAVSDKAGGVGLYAPLVGGSGLFDWRFNLGGVSDLLTGNGAKVVTYINPLNQEDTWPKFKTLDATLGKQLRTYSLEKNPSGDKGFLTAEMNAGTINTPAAGLGFWSQNTGGDADPCGAVVSSGTDVGNYQNAIRSFWQPEYDNWARSFNLPADIPAPDQFLSNATSMSFFVRSQVLCHEQTGDFTYATFKNDPVHVSSYWKDASVNPWISSSGTALAKTSAVAGGPTLPQAISNAEECVGSIWSSTKKALKRNPLLFLTAPISAPILAYNRAVNCADDLRFQSNAAMSDLITGLATWAAQGLAYHPASQYLHKLNQVGGTQGNANMDRRPFPVNPATGTPIPMVSITNSFTPFQYGSAPTTNSSSDQAVPTLSQDMGFGYPDYAKAGSHVRLHFTGISHMDVGSLDYVKYGPYVKLDGETVTDYDEAANRNNRHQMKTVLSRLLLGLASHQAPFILNGNETGATPDEIQGQYTHTVYENGANYRIQNGNEGVQGRISRLKGMDKRMIRKPVVLPYDYDAKSFYVSSAVNVENDEELFLPPGSTLDFRSGGSITVKNGGVFTIGGTPDFAVAKASGRTVTLQGADYRSAPIAFESGAKVRVPNVQAGHSYRLAFVTPTGRAVLRVKNLGSIVDYENNDLYAGVRETSPYITRQLQQGSSFGQAVFIPASLSAVKSLID